MSKDLVTGLILLLVLFGVVFYGVNYGFGAQCEKAGYTDANLEKCIQRRVDGGPVYEENINKISGLRLGEGEYLSTKDPVEHNIIPFERRKAD